MKLKEYFEETKGVGILSTADGAGKVDAAVYARPNIMDDGSLAFIMRDRLTHHNLQSNSHATYLFVENGPGYKGKRLYLTKVREEEDTELLESLRKRQYIDEKDEARYLVIFKLAKELPLIGEGTESGQAGTKQVEITILILINWLGSPIPLTAGPKMPKVPKLPKIKVFRLLNKNFLQ